MDTTTRRLTRRKPSSQFDRELIEANAAIELVASGAARRVQLANFRFAERIGATLKAAAEGVGVTLHVERDGPTTQSGLTIGPRKPSSLS